MKFGLLGQWLNLKNFWGLHDIKRRENKPFKLFSFFRVCFGRLSELGYFPPVQSKDFLDAGHKKFAKKFAKKKTLKNERRGFSSKITLH